MESAWWRSGRHFEPGLVEGSHNAPAPKQVQGAALSTTGREREKSERLRENVLGGGDQIRRVAVGLGEDADEKGVIRRHRPNAENGAVTFFARVDFQMFILGRAKGTHPRRCFDFR
jgi:hypothetical protein